MTIDERQEIGEYLDIIKRNCQNLLTSIEIMQDKIGDLNSRPQKSSKEIFLENN